jgi:hypothetical protein
VVLFVLIVLTNVSIATLLQDAFKKRILVLIFIFARTIGVFLVLVLIVLSLREHGINFFGATKHILLILIII